MMRRSTPFLLLIPVLLMDMTAKAALVKALSTTASKMAATERSFLCSDGMKIAAQHWTSRGADTPTQHRILCLHGWLDNCRSFHLLAPSLISSIPNSQVVALDFIGHGLSSHKSADGPPSVMSDAVFYVAETVQQLEWNSFTLVGHSMGAAISLIYAAAFPEQVDKLVLLEGAGPLTRKADDVAKHVRASVERRIAGNPSLYPQFCNGNGEKKQARIYPTLDAAVETRCKTASLSPGNQTLSKEASRAMVERATLPIESGGVQFLHDVRLQWPSLQYMTDEQVFEGLYKDVQSPVCLLMAENGWPFDESRKETVLEELKPTVFDTLPGSHHFHGDPETADAVAEKVREFLVADTSSS